MNPKPYLLPTLLALAACAPLLSQSHAQPGPCNIRTYGANGDGITLDTAPINAAVIACAAQGGGTVLVPPGIYRTGTIRLLDHITLHLEAGATLLGSSDLHDYPPSPRPPKTAILPSS